VSAAVSWSVVVRDGKPNDHPYVIECWISSALRHLEGKKAGLLKRWYQADLATSHLTVACLPEDQDAIIGYAVVSDEGQTLFTYTRRSARNLGVQRAIFERLRP
jgi:hypothetical protein